MIADVGPSEQEEAVMGQAIPRQHPAVVLRSHFILVRALLVAAIVAVIGLSVAVVILATNDESTTSAGAQVSVSAPEPGATRYDGGPDEGTRGILPAQPPASMRYDGGPEEGSRGALFSAAPSTASELRSDGGPEEGSRGLGH
jgi:hypothetical protein